MKAIRKWWRRQVFWHRFVRGACTDCGRGKPLVGATVCRGCFTVRLRKWDQS